jgi:hypothetical protein
MCIIHQDEPKMRRRSKALTIYPAMRNTTAGARVDVVPADNFLHAYCSTWGQGGLVDTTACCRGTWRGGEPEPAHILQVAPCPSSKFSSTLAARFSLRTSCILMDAHRHFRRQEQWRVHLHPFSSMVSCTKLNCVTAGAAAAPSTQGSREV